MSASGRSSSSLQVIEDFYGEELSLQLVGKIRVTPHDQLIELADRLVSYHQAIESAIALRRYGGVGSHVPGIEAVSTQPLAVHDDTYLYGASQYALADTPALKHLLLYNERLLLPDDTLAWAEEVIMLEEVGSDSRNVLINLGDSVRELLPLAPFVRAGFVVLVGPHWQFDPNAGDQDGTRVSLGMRCDLRGTITDHSILWQDPLLAWLVVNELNLVPRWQLEVWDLAAPEDVQEAAAQLLRNEYITERQLNDLVSAAYGSGITAQDIYGAIQLGFLHRETQ